MKLKIDDIIISPDRQRKTFNSDYLNELAESIRVNGLINPVAVAEVNDHYELMAGECRIKAHQLIGLDSIEATLWTDLDEWQRESIQLEENIRRSDLPWQERCNAMERVHSLYKSRSPILKVGGWTTRDTAEALHENQAIVSIELQLAKAMKDDPEIAKKETREAAYKALKIKKDLSFRRALAEVFADVASSQGESPIQIINGDSREELKKFDDEAFDFCITDIPYGIGFHEMQSSFPNRSEVRQGVEFDDSLDVLVDVVKPTMAEVYRLLKPSSHCYVFFAIARYPEIRDILEQIGFNVCHTPLFWIKNNALNLRPHIMYPVNYEPIFYCSKGYPPRPFSSIQLRSTFDYPILAGLTKVHPAEKPLPLIKQLIEICSQPKERGIDPFLGGGTFTLALKEMDRLGVGIELDQSWWLSAKMRLEGKESPDEIS